MMKVNGMNEKEKAKKNIWRKEKKKQIRKESKERKREEKKKKIFLKIEGRTK